MVDRWLNRLDIVDNIIVNNRNKQRVYNFDYHVRSMTRNNFGEDTD